MKPKLPKFRPALLLLCVPALIIAASLPKVPAAPATPATAPAVAANDQAISIEPHFSPEEAIAPTIVKLIDGTQHSLEIAAYAFTHPDIAAAVIRAHKRGVDVQIVMDMVEERDKTSVGPDLIAAGIPLRVRHKRGFQHNKYMILDRSIVITGSFNFTVSADERNAENIVVIRNAPKVEGAFAADYKLLVTDSRAVPSSP
jgi:phosphatidylserine/phosphatidylglycerophosphate/cardiolipin synthase-like enzyme